MIARQIQTYAKTPCKWGTNNPHKVDNVSEAPILKTGRLREEANFKNFSTCRKIANF